MKKSVSILTVCALILLVTGIASATIKTHQAGRHIGEVQTVCGVIASADFNFG